MVCLTVTTDIRGADNSRSKRVLIVSTGSNFAPGFTHAAETVADTLRQLESGPLELYSESLDIVRFTSDSYGRLFRNYLGEKYIDYPLDLILLIYVGNLGLAEKLLKELFPGVPIVAFGLTEEKIVPAQLGTHLIGLAQRSDPRGTLESIFRLQPEIRRIVVIGGTAEVDTHVVSRVREAARSLSGRAEFDFWTNRPMSEITQAVRSLPTQTVILFTRMYRDGAGQAFSSAQAVKSIIESANAPMYVMADTLLGSGAVGGSVADVMALARRAGQLAHDILSGVAPESLPFEIRTDGVPMFDWPALKRWGISEARLPPDSIIRNRPRSVWDQYRWYIIGALIIMTMQATMIVDLLVQRARRRRAESKQRETQEIMELAASAGELGLWMRDPKGGDFWANPQFRSLLGPDTNNALRFEDVVKRIHPDDRARMAAEIERAEQIGLPYEGEFRVVLLDGRERWIATRGRNVNDPRGRGARRMGVVLDITERKQAEERLRESEENFRRLVESTAAVIWEADIETWQFTYVGPPAVKLLGYPLEQWYEKDFWVSHIHPDDRERAIDTCLTMSQTAEEFEFNYRMIKASGDIVWVHDIVNCQHHDSKPKQLRGLMLDITERKNSEQTIRESEERFRTMANVAPVMIWMSGTDKLCTFFNKGWLDFTGRTLEQELGNGWAEGVHREDIDRCLEIYDNAFSARQEFTMEYRLRRFDGKYCWVLDHGVPRAEANGEFLGYIGCAVDIAERKRGELEAAQQRNELAHIARVSMMGELAASLAHELNQPLTAILSNAQAAQRFLASNTADLDEVREILEDIVQDNCRAGEVIGRMRALVKKENLQFTTLDLANMVGDVALLLHSDAILHNIRIALDINPGLPPVRGDRVQLQQVLLNLLLNAFDAMKDCAADAREITVRAERDGARLMRVAVCDRGAGVSGDKAEKIFQPFYTTKRDGLGMGLAISRSIIETHGGHLWVRNNADRGATFNFTLPASLVSHRSLTAAAP